MVLALGLDANNVDALTLAPLSKAKNTPVVIVNSKDSVATIVAKFTALNAKIVLNSTRSCCYSNRKCNTYFTN
ncbi:hypothetical protein [Clostridium sp.]|uniref:hypothetical protein n=1 Tax=Clostridium sp. TaxID=1506 RepID=UPI003EEC6830